MKQPCIVSFDIETFPITATTWGPKWEANLLEILEHIKIACFAYKILGKKKVYVYGQPDFKTYEEVVQKLWEVFDMADILIAHNGKQFDIKQSNAFFIKQGLPPPSPYKVIDTKVEAKRYFKFPSNSLNDLALLFNMGSKNDTGGYSLWQKCKANDPKAWAKMYRYNKQDVVLLEEIYLLMRPWMNTHPNLNAYTEREGCKACGSENTQYRGFNRNSTGRTHRFHCQDCGAWTSDTKSVKVTTRK